MTTAITSPTGRSGAGAGSRSLGLARLLRAEWTKLRTLRSTWITLLAAVGSSVGLAHLNAGAVAARSAEAGAGAAERAAVDPANTALVGVVLATVLLGALAARCIAIEYSTGMIDVTFMAARSRAAVLGTKAVLVALVATVVALPANALSYVVGVAALDSAGVDAHAPAGDAAGAIVSATGAVALFALIGLALGALTRRPAAANIALAVLVLGGQILAAAVPTAVRPYLPSAALEASVSLAPGPGRLGSEAALAVLGLYAVVLLAAAARALRADR